MQSFHCNACMRRLDLFADPLLPGHKKSFFSECKHVFCEKCKERFKPQCWICKKSTRFMEIRKDMPLHYRWFFEPLTKVSEAQQNAIEFQKNQENGVFGKLNSNINQLIRETKEIAEKQQEYERKYAAMLQKYRVLKFLDERLTEYREKRIWHPQYRGQRQGTHRNRRANRVPNPNVKQTFRPNRYVDTTPMSPRRFDVNTRYRGGRQNDSGVDYSR